MKLGKIIFVIFSISLGILAITISIVGHHGHFVFFRPHMLEDWVIWGAILLGVIGIITAIKMAIKPTSK